MDEEKRVLLLAAVTALLEAAPEHRLQITNLNEALIDLDLVTLRDFGEAVTGNTDVALSEVEMVEGSRQGTGVASPARPR